MRSALAKITKQQIQLIKILTISDLKWKDSFYRQWLDDNYNVKSCTDLTQGQASKAIRYLKEALKALQPAYLSASSWEERKTAWTAELFTPAAIQGLCLVENGEAPYKKTIDHIAGMLRDLTKDRRIKEPAYWATKFIISCINKPKIETKADGEKVRRACLARLNQNKRTAQSKRKKYALKNKKMEKRS